VTVRPLSNRGACSTQSDSTKGRGLSSSCCQLSDCKGKGASASREDNVRIMLAKTELENHGGI